MTDEWWEAFSNLTEEELKIAKPIIERNDFSDIHRATKNKRVQKVLAYYQIEKEDVERDNGR